jgi:hypothetical protein
MVFSGCVFLTRDKSHKLIRSDVDNTNWPYNDSLKLVITLNDTIFSIQEMEPCLGHDKYLMPQESVKYYVPDHLDLWMAFCDTLLPFVSFGLVNMMNGTILAPHKYIDMPYSCNARISKMGSARLCGHLGREDNEPIQKDHRVILDVTAPWSWSIQYWHDSFYVAIPPGDEIKLEESVDILNNQEAANLKPGRYWTQFKLSSTVWQDTTLPVWIGSIWSDTVWFELTD